VTDPEMGRPIRLGHLRTARLALNRGEAEILMRGLHREAAATATIEELEAVKELIARITKAAARLYDYTHEVPPL
jgi:hypothetical protein